MYEHIIRICFSSCSNYNSKNSILIQIFNTYKKSNHIQIQIKQYNKNQIQIKVYARTLYLIVSVWYASNFYEWNISGKINYAYRNSIFTIVKFWFWCN